MKIFFITGSDEKNISFAHGCLEEYMSLLMKLRKWVFLVSLLISSYLRAMNYVLEVHIPIQSLEGGPGFTQLLAGGSISFEPRQINYIGFPTIYGEGNRLQITTVVDTGELLPELNCIDGKEAIVVDSRDVVTTVNNFPSASTIRPSSYKKQKLVETYDEAGFYKRPPRFVDIESFPNFLTYVTQPHGFIRQVFTSGTITGSNRFFLTIKDMLLTSHNNLAKQAKVMGEYSVMKEVCPGRLPLQHLFRHLINHGSQSGLPESIALTDDLFHILYGNLLTICFTKSEAEKRKLKIAVLGDNTNYVIYLTGIPATPSGPATPQVVDTVELGPAAAALLQNHFVANNPPEGSIELQPLNGPINGATMTQNEPTTVFGIMDGLMIPGSLH